ncbi:hypothetical protein ACP70R_006274 [Stipagrostis hirtigluma subsp. patula]
MDTPRARSPRLPPPPPPRSAAASPSRDFSFAFSSPSSPFCGHLPHLPMSRTPVGRVGSDLSHNNHSRTTRHQTTTSYGGASSKDRDRSKNKASPRFFSGLGGVWRKETAAGAGVGEAAGKQGEERRKAKEKRGLDVGQWVKKHMASMVEQLRASFSRQGERERREQRRRPHSFSGHGPSSATMERERWKRRRGQLSSAPASLHVSPANSGHLSVGASVKVSTSSEESTMEELQSAIEAAIAHCKNSIAAPKQTAAAGGETGSLSKR